MNTPRRSTRRTLYLVGALPAVLMLLVSARLVLLLVHQDHGLDAYRSGDFAAARDEFDANQLLNPVERWVAPFGEGDARYRQGDYDGAVASFTVAVSSAPGSKECVVRVNLALAHEKLGDAAAAQGDRRDAEADWTRGLEALADCPRRADDPTRGRAAEVQARLLEKLAGAPEPPPASPPDPPPPDADVEARKAALEDQNEQAREKRREREQPREKADSEIPHW